MRVLVLSSVYPTPLRPTFGVFVRERIRAVARRCEVVVVAPIPWFPLNQYVRGRARDLRPTIEDDHGIPVFRPRVVCPPALGKCLDAILLFLSLLPVVSRVVRTFPFDLIDAHFAYPEGVAATLLGRRFARPAVVTLRGSHDLRQARYNLRRWQIRHALREAAAVVAVSASLCQFVHRLGVHRTVQVIPNGVDPLRFIPEERAAARARLGLDGYEPILLTVARLAPHKGQHLIIRALPDLVRRYPRLLYVAVGDAAPVAGYRRELEQLVTDLGLHEHVRLVGPRPHEEIPRWLAACDLFCLASRDEGCCNAILEALACGRPVIATAVGGNPELVRDGVDGFLVPYWDAEAFTASVRRGLATRWDAKAIAQRAQARSWDTTASEVLETFAAALATNR